jgi:hypothetical protein
MDVSDEFRLHLRAGRRGCDDEQGEYERSETHGGPLG